MNNQSEIAEIQEIVKDANGMDAEVYENGEGYSIFIYENEEGCHVTYEDVTSGKVSGKVWGHRDWIEVRDEHQYQQQVNNNYDM